MKILQLIQRPQNRGAETFACQLSNHLKNNGHEVKIVAVFPGSSTLPFKGEIEVLNANPSHRFYDFATWKKIAGIIKEFNPDIVQANAGDTLKYACFSRVIFRWNNTLVFRNASEVGRYLQSPGQKMLNRFFYKNIDHVISVSNTSEKDILNNFNFLKGKTEVIPIGLERVQIEEPKLLLSGETRNIIHVGGFTFEKNHYGLLNIMKGVMEEEQNVQLHMLGDGPLRIEIEEYARKINLHTKVKFYGFVNNPLSFIQEADVLVLPSIIEGLPGVLLEAMYLKVPVIAYDVGGISEIVTEETGFLIPQNDESQFKDKLLEVIRNTDEKKKERAYDMVTSKFLNINLARNFEDAYKRIKK